MERRADTRCATNKAHIVQKRRRCQDCSFLRSFVLQIRDVGDVINFVTIHCRVQRVHALVSTIFTQKDPVDCTSGNGHLHIFFLIPNSMFASSLVRCTRTTATSSRLTSFVPRSQSLLLPFRVNYLSTTTRAMSAFERLIRFEDKDGKTVYGNLEKEVPTKEIEGSSVEVLEGDVKSGFKKTGQKTTVGKVCIRMSIEEKIRALGKI